jgi:hypothetical protein
MLGHAIVPMILVILAHVDLFEDGSEIRGREG